MAVPSHTHVASTDGARSIPEEYRAWLAGGEPCVLCGKVSATRTIIYSVWGPTAEWGDGYGPLAYFEDREMAENYIEAEKRETVDMAHEFASDRPGGFEEVQDSNLCHRPGRHNRDCEYEAARAIVGWPYDYRDYSVQEEDAEELARLNGTDTSDMEALLELLNTR